MLSFEDICQAYYNGDMTTKQAHELLDRLNFSADEILVVFTSCPEGESDA